MACLICKRRQIATLENIVAIDRILFPESAPKRKLSETDLNQYNKIKNAMLVNLYEIYKVTDFISENVYENGIKEINAKSYQRGGQVFRETVKLLKTDSVLNEINSDVNELVKTKQMTYEDAKSSVIVKSLMEIALDKLMLESAIKNSDKAIFETTHGELLVQAHKSFRNDLIRLALK